MSPAGWQGGDNVNQVLNSKDKQRSRTNHGAERESSTSEAEWRGQLSPGKQMVDRVVGHREISTQ